MSAAPMWNGVKGNSFSQFKSTKALIDSKKWFNAATSSVRYLTVKPKS